MYQCITVRQWTARYHLCTLVHYSCALFCIFYSYHFYMRHLLSLSFMLQLHHVAPFCVLDSFHVALVLCCTHLFSLFPCCTFFILLSFQVAHFLCRGLFMLQFSVLRFSFHVALFSCCTFSTVALFSCCNFCVLFSCYTFFVCTLFVLHFFHDTLFSY